MTGDPGRTPRPSLDTESRHDLRREFRLRRRAVGAHERRAAARAIARLLTSANLLRPGTRIAIYLAHDGEIDPTVIARTARRHGARLFLPVITRASTGRMRFAPLDSPPRAWRYNRYGISEPGAVPRLHRGAQGLDLVLLPLVAFDRDGHRLGMGGGYYDRALAFRGRRGRWHRPILVGLAFDCQEATSLRSAAWDMPLDMVATPTRIILISPKPLEAP